MPYKVWSNAKGIPDFQFGGYCTHSSILFVTWHRPYVALFEVRPPSLPLPPVSPACLSPYSRTPHTRARD